MNRRTWTLLTSVVLVVAIGLLGAFVRVPFVALGPGPTYNTLGTDGKTDVVRINGQQTFPTAGNLNMTTVSLTDQVSLFGAVGLWASGRFALAPRELYFPPDKSEQQVDQQNTQEFTDSETSAETAALRHLHYPMKVAATEIVKGSPADGSIGIGDRLVAVDDKPVTGPESVRAALAGRKPGEQVRIRLQHDREPERTVTVPLAADRADPQQGFLGVAAQERPDINFGVDISLADVGGPSAGLMLSLAVVDKLTPGELNGGRFIAGTGEIDPMGKVAPIGGIPFKMLAAREAGATSFLVPAENCSEAKSQAPDGLQLAKVGNLDDATKALEDIRSGRAPAGC